MTSLSFLYNPLHITYYKFTISYILLTPLTLYLLMTKKLFIFQWHIFTLNITSFSFPVIFDAVGTLTATTVLFISANVMKFAKLYMKLDQFMPRFSHLIILFVLSMTLLVFLPTLPTILLGWDGLGLTSFLLVVYYQNAKSLSGGMLTALTNRLGDVAILMAIALMLNSNQYYYSHPWENKYLMFISLMLLTASLTKSAQMPFSSWLPAAMAAPTPVSALVHSSTLVTAGIFLQIRFSEFLFSSPKINFIILFISSMTMFMSGLSATMEYDMKKVIALSTLSQLSVMMTSLAMNLPSLALFHLITHAMFKALMFICAGTFINTHSHNQDLRLMMNLHQQMPTTTSCFLVANMSLCAMPFMAGFYSKDLIIELLMMSILNLLSMMLILIAIGMTTAYSLRLMIMTLWKPNTSTPMNKIFDLTPSINYPTMTLTLGAVTTGSVMNWMILPFAIPVNLTMTLKLTALTIVISSFFMVWMMNAFNSPLISMKMNYSFIYEMSSSMWFLTPLSTQMPIRYMNIGHTLLKTIDNGWLESTSAQGIHQSLLFFSKTLQPFQANIINIYLHLSLMLVLPMTLLF